MLTRSNWSRKVDQGPIDNAPPSASQLTRLAAGETQLICNPLAHSHQVPSPKYMISLFFCPSLYYCFALFSPLPSCIDVGQRQKKDTHMLPPPRPSSFGTTPPLHRTSYSHLRILLPPPPLPLLYLLLCGFPMLFVRLRRLVVYSMILCPSFDHSSSTFPSQYRPAWPSRGPLFCMLTISPLPTK